MAGRQSKKTHRIHQLFNGSLSKRALEKLSRDINSPDFEQEWLRENWTQAENEINSQLAGRMWQIIRNRTLITLQRPNWWGIAATITLLIVSALFISQQITKSYTTDSQVAVEVGQKGQITLPDGTKVWLNADSEINYGSRFNNRERIVHLDGEAYFEVAKNPHAPFIVKSDRISVRALGTAFNLKAYQEDPVYTLVLIEGEVEASDDHNRINLLPDQKISYHKSERRMEKTNLNDSQLATNWMHNKFSFDSEPFAGIALTLERSFGVHIVFESVQLKSIRYSGTLEINSLEEILNIISLTSPLTYRINDTTVFLNINPETLEHYLTMTRD